MLTGILTVLVIVLAIALASAIRWGRNQRFLKNALYMSVSLPKAADVVSLPRCETPEYKLEQALRREARLEGARDQLTAENIRLTAENRSLDLNFQELRRDYLGQFSAGRQVVDGIVTLTLENERLRVRLTEETIAKEILTQKLQRIVRSDAMVH